VVPLPSLYTRNKISSPVLSFLLVAALELIGTYRHPVWALFLPLVELRYIPAPQDPSAPVAIPCGPPRDGFYAEGCRTPMTPFSVLGPSFSSLVNLDPEKPTLEGESLLKASDGFPPQKSAAPRSGFLAPLAPPRFRQRNPSVTGRKVKPRSTEHRSRSDWLFPVIFCFDSKSSSTLNFFSLAFVFYTSSFFSPF